MARTILVSVDVEDHQVHQVVEVMSRVMMGLLLDGIECRMQAYTTPDDVDVED